jgi:membrane protein DedA with SNARE-associated domain
MLDWLVKLIEDAGLLGVFLLMVLENLFPPIPSEVIMPLAGFTAARGQMSILGVILAGSLGAVAGNAVWYELAHAFGAARTRALVGRYGRWVGIGPEEIGKAEDTLRRNGPVAVFFGRFMPGIRTAISVPAGLVELPRHVFYTWTALGTLIWTSGLALGGYVLEDQFHKVEEWAGPIGLAALGAALVAIGWHFWKARRASAASQAPRSSP